MIHCFEALQSDHVSRIIGFRTALQSAYCESFDSERDFKVPTGDKSNSAEAGMHRPEGENPPYKSHPDYM